MSGLDGLDQPDLTAPLREAIAEAEQLIASAPFIETEQDLLETDDGALVFIQYHGRVDIGAGRGAPLYSTPRFETRRAAAQPARAALRRSLPRA